MAGKFELKTAANGQVMFNLKAGNGEIILTSELYAAKSSALNGIGSVKNNSSSDANFERKKSAKGDFFFELKARNGQSIGKSEIYSSEAAMENGIKSVMKNGGTDKVDDITQKA